MAETSARTLRLLSLLQSRRDRTGPELAEKLGVSVRTVRRDVETLRTLGYPVTVTRGPGGAYRLGAGGSLPPLILDDEQAVAITVALQTAPTSVLGVGDAAGRALDTLRQVLPARLRHQVEAVQITSISNAWDLPVPAVDPQLLVAVGAAVRAREVLRFDPRRGDGPSPPLPPRRVEPHHLVVWSGRWYLVAFDLDQQEWNTVRVDRMSLRSPNGPRFGARPLPGGDVAEFVRTDGDRGDPPDAWPCNGTAVLPLEAPLVARWAPGGARVEALSPNSCRLTLGAWSWTAVAALLGTFATDLDEVTPAELRRACRTLSQRYARAGDARAPS